MLKYLIFILIILFSKNLYSLETEWSIGPESKVRLISPISHNNNENKLILGIEYELNEGWKTYWKSPGEGGFPQQINWELSKNIKNLKILWPTPSYFEILGFNSIGYSEKVVFPIEIEIENISNETLLILDVNYLTCEKVCIPAKAFLQMNIPPGKANYTKYNYTIQKALSFVPRKISENSNKSINFNTKAFKNENKVSITINISSKNIIKYPEIFIHSEYGLPVLKPKIKFSTNLKNIEAKFDYDKSNFSTNNFFINAVFKDSQNTFQFDEDVDIENFSKIRLLNNSIIYILLISLIGGVILNIMPCVLPVLSIKVLSLLNKPKDSLSIRKSFLITSLGIVSSFTLLAIILVILKLIGINIFWGFQFQQPIFLLLIASIIFLFSINMFGFFEFKVPQFMSYNFLDNQNKNYINDFFNGFFATILATPCSAPFVGTAITAAFTQSSLAMIGIFIFMGLGMSSPYLLISTFPSIAKILPKPGKWMQIVKYFLGILLFATFVWIVSILANNYFFEKFSNYKNDSDWLDFNKINLQDLKNENSIIFIDITADWCATCQFNKINVINSEEIKEYFEKFDVIKVQGDWTKPNKKIENYLKSFGKFGIPFNVIYVGQNDTVILSELLSRDDIIDILN